MQSVIEAGGVNRVTRLAPDIIAEVDPTGATTPMSLSLQKIGDLNMAEIDSGTKGPKPRVARHENLDGTRSDEKVIYPVGQELTHVTGENGTYILSASMADAERLPIGQSIKPSSLFQLWQESNPDADTFMVVGVPIVNYKYRHAAYGSMARAAQEKSLLQHDSLSHGDGVPRIWICEVSGTSGQKSMDLFCNSLVGTATCVFEGHPSNGGVRELIINATDGELHQTVVQNRHILHMCTADTEFRLTPEKEEAEDSLLETKTPKYGEWGLDRITNRRTHTLDGIYNAPQDGGAGVHVYVMDTGIRTTHEQFEGRAVPTLESLRGKLTVCRKGDTECSADRQGHGTHCAGVVGGRDTGVAKSSIMHAVKVLGDDGVGDLMNIVEAMDWVLSDGERPAIVSASLGGPGAPGALGRMIEEATDQGVTVVVAAGNENDDACKYTPSSVSQAITVGSTMIDDSRSSFSNYGKCVDIFGPGSRVGSTGVDSDTHIYSLSGTSIACPHVAGAVALLLWEGVDPKKTSISLELQRDATENVVGDAKDGSPNKLLHVRASNNTADATQLSGWQRYQDEMNAAGACSMPDFFSFLCDWFG
jgi:hypothetical protein